MARKIIVPAKRPKIRIVNRCIMCGKIIPRGDAICSKCNLKRILSLRKGK